MAKPKVTDRDLIEALSRLEQDALVVCIGADGCRHAFCENNVLPPTILPMRNNKYRPGEVRYVLDWATRMGNEYLPLLQDEKEEELA